MSCYEIFEIKIESEWRCRSVGRSSDRHAAEARSVPRCGKGFFSQSQLSVQTFLQCSHTPVCNRMHSHLCALERSSGPHQSSMDYGNTKTASIHRKLGSATLSQLAFPGEKSNLHFPWKNPNRTIQLFKKGGEIVISWR